MLVDVVSIVCIAFFAVLALFVLGKIIVKSVKSRKEAITYVRSFKKGKCAIVLLPVFALYWVGLSDSGENVIRALYTSIETALGFLVLKYDLAGIEDLMKDNDLYKHAVYAGMLIVLLNAALFVFSWLGQYLVCWIRRVIDRLSCRDRLVLVGNTPENILVYHSDTTRRKLLLEEATAGDRTERQKEEEKLYIEGVAFQFTNALEAEIRKRIRWAQRRNKECVIVVNTGDDKRNIICCKAIAQHLASGGESTKTAYQKLNVYVFGDPRYETIYADVMKEGKGCIHYVNKYLKIAMDFVDRYPFAQFMNEKQIDYQTSLIKQGVNINAILIGFGKTNQQIFLTSVANNQFLTGSEADPKLKPVKYLIIDKEKAENEKNLNHSYYRFKKECCDRKGNFILQGYLDPPAMPAEEELRHWNINDKRLYGEIKSMVTRKPDDANFIVVAFGSDLENIDLAQKLVEKRREWGVKNLTIFVKVRAWSKETTFLGDADCYFIGHERDAIYHIDKITNDKIYQMSQERDVFYRLAKEASHPDADQRYEELCAAASREWHTDKTQTERESSLYCCLSLRSKLQLMGLDYCTEQEARDYQLRPYNQKAYWEHMAGDDMPHNSAGEGERPAITFADLNYPQSRRKTMAIHEHMRWNSFMISKGMIPASIKDIVEERVWNPKKQQMQHSNGKNYALRRHGNLTTMDGLVAFRRLVADREESAQQEALRQGLIKKEERKPWSVLEEEADVIKYDYQILDDAHWLLRTQGYQIVEKAALQAARKGEKKQEKPTATAASK